MRTSTQLILGGVALALLSLALVPAAIVTSDESIRGLIVAGVVFTSGGVGGTLAVIGVAIKLIAVGAREGRA